jgi:hypothetical protein
VKRNNGQETSEKRRERTGGEIHYDGVGHCVVFNQGFEKKRTVLARIEDCSIGASDTVISTNASCGKQVSPNSNAIVLILGAVP